MTETIRVGSRDSKLAVIQSEIIIKKINERFPEIKTELVTMKTTGDRILDKSLDKVGGKGLFVKELDIALLEGRVDITVHSLKDMPVEENTELPVIAYSKRATPFDALVLPKEIGRADFLSAVGCSSGRRALQLKSIFPSAEIKPIRGNVPSRLEKLDRGEYSALILAAAGLERLGLSDRISREFSAEEILPAAGQGIIAVSCRRGFEFLKEISDFEGEACAKAERAFIKRLGGGCFSPAAAFCEVKGERLYIRGLNVKDGKAVKAEIWGDIDEGERLGAYLAERLM